MSAARRSRLAPRWPSAGDPDAGLPFSSPDIRPHAVPLPSLPGRPPFSLSEAELQGPVGTHPGAQDPRWEGSELSGG